MEEELLSAAAIALGRSSVSIGNPGNKLIFRRVSEMKALYFRLVFRRRL
jgi:hypothetical protein